ncbi:hypothetical protein Apa02nite_092900 [Actinoplanes palleronii]|uniref:Uncharacterized protein n=1 Tax=Actinoplanes palleronii TaxID=113570 RepID=A0ABQ4BRB3_9ACTN|nr:hypothetical protein Apa02nite_092900 [Actinoplanes palleronii]
MVSAPPSRDGSRYGTCTCTWCSPSATGVDTRPQPAGTPRPSISSTGVKRPSRKAGGAYRRVTAMVAPPSPRAGSSGGKPGEEGRYGGARMATLQDKPASPLLVSTMEIDQG